MATGSEGINLKKALADIEKEKGIRREILLEAIEAAVLSAARKKLGAQYDMEARYNEDSGEVEVFRWLHVVDEVQDPHREIALEEARERLDAESNIDDELGEKLDTSMFGRIAAQTAKQVIIQRVRKAERELVYGEYKDRKGELVTGIVRRFERQDIVIDLGRAEAVLSKNEQIPKETYRIGDRLQAYIKDVRNEDKGSIITLSRTDEGFLIKLFEMEVPEIYEGIVRIVSAARDPGVRAKIAVTSRDHDVDPVGACVGVKGARVQAVVQELRGEKIDIVLYSEDPARFVCNAIAPAQVSRVIIDEEKRSMELIVPDDQQSLAIGRKGQNVRLAAKLTGWNIDIVSELEVSRAQERTYELMSKVAGIEKDTLLPLFKLGYRSERDIVKADLADLAIIPGIGTENAEKIKEAAAQALEEGKRLAQQSQQEAKAKRAEKAKAPAAEAPAAEKAAEAEAPTAEAEAPTAEEAEEAEAAAEQTETQDSTEEETTEEETTEESKTESTEDTP